MKNLRLLSPLFSCLRPYQWFAQNITLRYGQIPSMIKTVSALHIQNIGAAQRFFSREGSTLEMLPIEGGPRIW